jgi:hypothetical protein
MVIGRASNRWEAVNAALRREPRLLQDFEPHADFVAMHKIIIM